LSPAEQPLRKEASVACRGQPRNSRWTRAGRSTRPNAFSAPTSHTLQRSKVPAASQGRSRIVALRRHVSAKPNMKHTRFPCNSWDDRGTGQQHHASRAPRFASVCVPPCLSLTLPPPCPLRLRQLPLSPLRNGKAAASRAARLRAGQEEVRPTNVGKLVDAAARKKV